MIIHVVSELVKGKSNKINIHITITMKLYIYTINYHEMRSIGKKLSINCGILLVWSIICRNCIKKNTTSEQFYSRKINAIHKKLLLFELTGS